MIDSDVLETVTGGAGSLAAAPATPQEQVLYDHALAYLNGTGGSWQLGAAHHQGLKVDTYLQANDPTRYKAVFANDGDHTAQVLMNPDTGQAVRRLR